jgi:hypothetical protein
LSTAIPQQLRWAALELAALEFGEEGETARENAEDLLWEYFVDRFEMLAFDSNAHRVQALLLAACIAEDS